MTRLLTKAKTNFDKAKNLVEDTTGLEVHEEKNDKILGKSFIVRLKKQHPTTVVEALIENILVNCDDKFKSQIENLKISQDRDLFQINFDTAGKFLSASIFNVEQNQEVVIFEKKHWEELKGILRKFHEAVTKNQGGFTEVIGYSPQQLNLFKLLAEKIIYEENRTRQDQDYFPTAFAPNAAAAQSAPKLYPDLPKEPTQAYSYSSSANAAPEKFFRRPSRTIDDLLFTIPNGAKAKERLGRCEKNDNTILKTEDDLISAVNKAITDINSADNGQAYIYIGTINNKYQKITNENKKEFIDSFLNFLAGPQYKQYSTIKDFVKDFLKMHHEWELQTEHNLFNSAAMNWQQPEPSAPPASNSIPPAYINITDAQRDLMFKLLEFSITDVTFLKEAYPNLAAISDIELLKIANSSKDHDDFIEKIWQKNEEIDRRKTQQSSTSASAATAALSTTILPMPFIPTGPATPQNDREKIENFIRQNPSSPFILKNNTDGTISITLNSTKLGAETVENRNLKDGASPHQSNKMLYTIDKILESHQNRRSPLTNEADQVRTYFCKEGKTKNIELMAIKFDSNNKVMQTLSIDKMEYSRTPISLNAILFILREIQNKTGDEAAKNFWSSNVAKAELSEITPTINKNLRIAAGLENDKSSSTNNSVAAHASPTAQSSAAAAASARTPYGASTSAASSYRASAASATPAASTAGYGTSAAPAAVNTAAQRTAPLSSNPYDSHLPREFFTGNWGNSNQTNPAHSPLPSTPVNTKTPTPPAAAKLEKTDFEQIKDIIKNDISKDNDAIVTFSIKVIEGTEYKTLSFNLLGGDAAEDKNNIVNLLKHFNHEGYNADFSKFYEKIDQNQGEHLFDMLFNEEGQFVAIKQKFAKKDGIKEKLYYLEGKIASDTDFNIHEDIYSDWQYESLEYPDKFFDHFVKFLNFIKTNQTKVEDLSEEDLQDVNFIKTRCKEPLISKLLNSFRIVQEKKHGIEKTNGASSATSASAAVSASAASATVIHRTDAHAAAPAASATMATMATTASKPQQHSAANANSANTSQEEVNFYKIPEGQENPFASDPQLQFLRHIGQGFAMFKAKKKTEEEKLTEEKSRVTYKKTISLSEMEKKLNDLILKYEEKAIKNETEKAKLETEIKTIRLEIEKTKTEIEMLSGQMHMPAYVGSDEANPTQINAYALKMFSTLKNQKIFFPTLSLHPTIHRLYSFLSSPEIDKKDKYILFKCFEAINETNSGNFYDESYNKQLILESKIYAKGTAEYNEKIEKLKKVFEKIRGFFKSEIERIKKEINYQEIINTDGTPEVPAFYDLIKQCIAYCLLESAFKSAPYKLIIDQGETEEKTAENIIKFVAKLHNIAESGVTLENVKNYVGIEIYHKSLDDSEVEGDNLKDILKNIIIRQDFEIIGGVDNSIFNTCKVINLTDENGGTRKEDGAIERLKQKNSFLNQDLISLSSYSRNLMAISDLPNNASIENKFIKFENLQQELESSDRNKIICEIGDNLTDNEAEIIKNAYRHYISIILVPTINDNDHPQIQAYKRDLCKQIANALNLSLQELEAGLNQANPQRKKWDFVEQQSDHGQESASGARSADAAVAAAMPRLSATPATSANPTKYYPIGGVSGHHTFI